MYIIFVYISKYAQTALNKVLNKSDLIIILLLTITTPSLLLKNKSLISELLKKPLAVGNKCVEGCTLFYKPVKLKFMLIVVNNRSTIYL